MPGFLIGPITGFVDRMKGKGTCSSSFLQQVGKSSAQSAGGGNIFAGISAAGIGNGADTTEDTLFTATLPANILDVMGRCITIQAWGNVTATTSAIKTVKIYFGASIVLTVGAWTTTQTGNWQANIQIYKVSSNVQAAVAQFDALGITGTARVAQTFAGTETDTAAIICKVTGQSSSAATANLVLCNGFIIDGYN